MASGNDPLGSFLSSIQVTFSPVESNFRNFAKNFEHCFNGVVKNGASDDIKVEQLNLKDRNRNVVINVDDRKNEELPLKIFLGMCTEKCEISSNNYDFQCGGNEKVNVNLSENDVNSNGNRLRFNLALPFVIGGFLQAILSPLKADKMGLQNMRNKGSSSCDVRVKLGSRMVGRIKTGKDLPFDHLMAFVFDQLNSFPKSDVVMKDHECMETDYEALAQPVNQFRHFKALTSILVGKRTGMNGFIRNLNFARVGGVPSNLLGVTTIEDVGVNCNGNNVNMDEIGGNSTKKLLGRSMSSVSAPPVEISTDSVLKSALAAGISCAFSTFLMHPVDTVKVQASNLSFTEILAKLPQIGVRGLYMGSIPAIVGQFSSHGLRAGIYEASKIVLINVAPSLPEIQVHSVASFLGTFLGTTMRIPCEVLKQRLQAGQFNHVGEALVGTFQQDGLGGFFRGTGMTLCRELPFYVFGSGLYAESKKAVQKLLGRELHPWETVAVGAVSGGLTAVLTTPFDVIKTRMMTALHGQPTTMSIVALSILRDEGPLGLFRGAIPRFFWVAPLGAINFAGYELVRKAMD